MCPPDWRSFAPVSDATPSSRFARQACWLPLAPLLAVSAAYGQEPSDEALKPLSKAYVKNILLDQKAIWTSPFHMTRKDAQWWLTFGAIVSVAVATDRRTSRQLPNTADQVAFSSHVSQLGAAYTLIPIAGGFYVTGVLAKKAEVARHGAPWRRGARRCIGRVRSSQNRHGPATAPGGGWRRALLPRKRRVPVRPRPRELCPRVGDRASVPQ